MELSPNDVQQIDAEFIASLSCEGIAQLTELMKAVRKARRGICGYFMPSVPTTVA